MRTKILTPWFALSSETERNAFVTFLNENKIDIEMVDGNSVQLAHENWTADLLKNIEDDFDTWCEEFHEDILKEEYTKIAIIVSMCHESAKHLANALASAGFEENFETRILLESEDYFEIFTPFFQYTIYTENRNKWYLSATVDCYPLGGEWNGEADVTISESGELEVTHRPH